MTETTMTENKVTATQQARQWLDNFEETLNSDNPAQAADLFEGVGFWRDLVTMTWNIKTMEGREAIRDMLSATAKRTQPANWQVSEEATEQDGVIDA
jgi:putative flavoprotein involved in K+ transport